MSTQPITGPSSAGALVPAQPMLSPFPKLPSDIIKYMLFVTYFPHLIAGPILHHKEMMPQFATATCRFEKENFAVGLTLLIFGLFKKGVLSDQLAAVVDPVFARPGEWCSAV